jgi:hypothetical protein
MQCTPRTLRRIVARMLVASSLLAVLSVIVAVGTPASHAAPRTPNEMLSCHPSIWASATTTAGSFLPLATVSGQCFTPGGQVRVVGLENGSENFLLGTVTTTVAHLHCINLTCYIVPGGTFSLSGFAPSVAACGESLRFVAMDLTTLDVWIGPAYAVVCQ